MRRAPQDGRFTLSSEHSSEIDIRTATLPTKHGERMTLRLLATQTQDLTLGRLGMSSADLERFEHVIHRPNGLIIMTGPTGCGKSTTLYAAIENLDQAEIIERDHDRRSGGVRDRWRVAGRSRYQ